jgi:hypothetical protein
MSQKKLWLLIVRTKGEDFLFAHSESCSNTAEFASQAVLELGELNVEAIEIIPADASEVVKLAQQMRVKPSLRPGRKAA